MQYVHHYKPDGSSTLEVNQTAYIDTMMERFGLEDDQPKKETPLPKMAAGTDQSLFDGLGKGFMTKEETEWMKKYNSFPTIIGSLIHAMVHTRPDISYAVSVLSRAMSKPQPYHWKAARRVFQYLKGTRRLGLMYDRLAMLRMEPHLITAAVDSSFADCEFTARSTSGFVVWFGGTPVAWECKRQPLVTLSTMESEYVAASRCVSEIRFLHKLMDWIGIDRPHPTKCHEDNAACIAITSNPVHKQRSKHIAVKYHNVREAVKNNEVTLVQVWTEHQTADIFTKSLGKAAFKRFRSCLIGSVSDPMVHYDTMMQTHLRQVAGQQGTECIKMFHVCGSHCKQKSQIGGYSFNLRGNEGHENLDGDLSLRSGAQRWPELVIPFEKDNPIKKIILNGWFDTAAGA